MSAGSSTRPGKVVRGAIVWAALLAGACGPSADEPEAPVATEGSAGGEDAASESEPGDGDDAAELPTPYEPAQGQSAWGVYLVQVPNGNAPEAREAIEALRARGLEVGGAGELSCDQGAAETLGLPPETLVVSVAFATEDDARLFVERWGSEVLGVAPFVAFCRD